LEDEFPLKMGYFQGRTVNLPEGISLLKPRHGFSGNTDLGGMNIQN
jgi:hypothetical protein